MDDFGAFFVSLKVLDGEALPKYIVRDDLGIPIANGIQIYFDVSDECELVTIHTIREVFPEIEQFLEMENGNKFELIYENDTYVKFKKI